MKQMMDNLERWLDDMRDNAAKGSVNCDKPTAVNVNHGGEEYTRHYMNRNDINDKQGPNWNLYSKDADGDTSASAGVFR
jgi:hypothetical protein